MNQTTGGGMLQQSSVQQEGSNTMAGTQTQRHKDTKTRRLSFTTAVVLDKHAVAAVDCAGVTADVDRTGLPTGKTTPVKVGSWTATAAKWTEWLGFASQRPCRRPCRYKTRVVGRTDS